MDKAIVARWREWTGDGVQHLVVNPAADGVVAEAVVLSEADGQAFAARFRIICDDTWRTRQVEASVLGDERRVRLTSDGEGRWRDGEDRPLPDLDGAIDVDLSLTPFTNSLPIRRLDLAAGASAEIAVAYVRLPALAIEPAIQRYVCLDPERRYRYESQDGAFVREIDIDDHGLVVTYPGLFRRVL